MELIDSILENRAALDLFESQERFRLLAALVPHLIWTSTPKGLLVHCSPRWLEYLGFDPSTRPGGWSAAVHPDDLPGVRQRWFEACAANSPARMDGFHIRLRRHDGVYRWFFNRTAAINDHQGRLLQWLGAALDVDDRKRAGEARADKEFLLGLGQQLQRIPNAPVIAQVATQRLGEYLNAARCGWLTLSPGKDSFEIQHEYLRDGSPPLAGVHSLDLWDARILALLASGETVAIENTATDPRTAAAYPARFGPMNVESHLLVPLLRSAEWVGVLGVADSVPRRWSRRELTLVRASAQRVWPAYEAARALAAERVLHESLATSEERLRLALESSSVGTWDCDPCTSELVLDERCRTFFGIAAGSPVTIAAFRKVLHPEDRKGVRKALQSMLDPNGGGHTETEFRVIGLDDGVLRFLAGQGQAFFSEENGFRRATRFVGSLQDISARKRDEQALRRANVELEQFAYAAAHDLQEPLRNVGLCTQLVAARYKGRLDPQADEFLASAVAGAQRMQAMVKDLLSYARALDGLEGANAVCDSDAILTAALNNLTSALAERAAQVDRGPLPHVRMHGTHLLQVFQNLIGNALKYGGVESPCIQVSAALGRGQCTFSVEDNGIGIAPEYHQRVFRVFKRLHDRDVTGTGVGLATCKRIVEHYGGRIWILSQAGRGATFLFTAPLAEKRL